MDGHNVVPCEQVWNLPLFSILSSMNPTLFINLCLQSVHPLGKLTTAMGSSGWKNIRSKALPCGLGHCHSKRNEICIVFFFLTQNLLTLLSSALGSVASWFSLMCFTFSLLASLLSFLMVNQ